LLVNIEVEKGTITLFEGGLLEDFLFSHFVHQLRANFFELHPIT